MVNSNAAASDYRPRAVAVVKDDARRIAANIAKLPDWPQGFAAIKFYQPTRVGSNKPDSDPRTSSSLRNLRSLSSRIDNHPSGIRGIRRSPTERLSRRAEVV